jgi:hypothetical protein
MPSRPIAPAVASATLRPLARHEPEVRCGCGSLLARVVEGTVELKCRRCKRTWRIPLERS